MNAPEIAVAFFSVLMLLPTIASISTLDQWWVRAFDFPRLQISVLILAMLIFSVTIYSYDDLWHYLLSLLLLLSFFYQAANIYPYTIFARRQVIKYKGKDKKRHVSILVSNVLMTNRKYERLLNLVREQDPDVLLTLETDKGWEKELAVLEKDYPYTVKVPKSNLYGMHLYSKMELKDIEVKYLISDEIPSIHGVLKLDDEGEIRIHCLHPKPPSPTEDDSSTNRDAELLLVGHEIKKSNHSTLVFGDLNDVAWSRTTRLFQKLSGLLDPRIGRGFYNTFHTGYPIFRWPLDHVFHTDDFSLVSLKRLKSIGSDHFPIYIKLNHRPNADNADDRPEEVDQEEKEWSEEKIEKGHPKDRDINA